MKTTEKYDDLPTKVLSALAMLDQKGADETVTRAMAIVHEAFLRHSAKQYFSAHDLFVLAQY